MRFTHTSLPGACIIEPEPAEDSRGFFARTFCAREFGERSLTTQFVQCSTSVSFKRGTLRGLHYQVPPAEECKLVRCTAGAIHEVIVDLRPDSPTCGRHLAVELNSRNRLALYVPAMFAHGFQTLEENTEILYQISEFFSPEHARGHRYDDPAFGIQWPLPVSAISEKDLKWPGFRES